MFTERRMNPQRPLYEPGPTGKAILFALIFVAWMTAESMHYQDECRADPQCVLEQE